MAWLDITKDLTEEGIRELEVGQVLIFNFEGSPIHLKIMRKARGKIWAKRTYMPTPEEVTVKDRVD